MNLEVQVREGKPKVEFLETKLILIILLHLILILILVKSNKFLI